MVNKVKPNSDKQLADKMSRNSLIFLNSLAIANMSAKDRQTFLEESKKKGSQVDERLFVKAMKKTVGNIDVNNKNGIIDSLEMREFINDKKNAPYLRNLADTGVIDKKSYGEVVAGFKKIDKQIEFYDRKNNEIYQKDKRTNKYATQYGAMELYFDMVRSTKTGYKAVTQNDEFFGLSRTIPLG